MEEYKGFYYNEKEKNIYYDVTDKVKSFFGKTIINKALYHIQYFYDWEIQTFEEYINSNYKSLLEKIWINNEKIDLSGQSIIIEFTNGTMVKFRISEWGVIEKL